MKRCRDRVRHWFTYYGMVGSSRPTCFSCGEPNPNYRPDDDPYFVDAYEPEPTAASPYPKATTDTKGNDE